jgi:hypothetical protein
MTPAEVITEVRRIVQDTKAPQRYSEAELLGYVNMTLKRMVMLRPDLFSTIEDIPTAENTVLQSLPSGAVRLVEVFRVKNGNAITEVSREMLDQSTPDWTVAPAGSPVNFVRHVRNPTRYYLYPPPTKNLLLVGEYVKTPPTYTINQQITVLPDAYLPALVDGTVFLAESVDNEHVNSNRAKLYQDSFIQTLGVSLQSRATTDTEEGGLEPKQVIR